MTETQQARCGNPDDDAAAREALYGAGVTKEDICDIHVHTVPAARVPPDAPGADTAIIVCHGMGQQVKWQTLEQFVRLLGEPTAAHPIEAQIVRLPGRDGEADVSTGRVAVDVQTPAGTRRVHVYEAYWAPLTEGRVTLRDVVGFLTDSGWRGLRHARQSFRRFIFDRCVKLRQAHTIRFQLGAALLVVLALFAINTVIGGVAGSLLLSGGDGPFASAALRQRLTIDLLAYVAVVGLWAALMLAAGSLRARGRARDATYVVPGAVQWALKAGAAAVCAATVVTAGLMLFHTIVYYDAAAGDLSTAWSLTFVVVWAIAIFVNWRARRLVVQYLGDVAAYLSAHQVSRFHEIRDQILEASCGLATALYRQPYRQYVIVGHSLGSVVAYDTLNRLLLAEATGQLENVASRTAALITFGSPLDKTAFIFREQQAEGTGLRESLASAIQPLITLPRPAIGRWVNIHSRNDIISGELHYYGGAVENVVDRQADLPILAHVQFWENEALRRAIVSSLAGRRDRHDWARAA